MTQGYQLVETSPSFTPLRFGLLSAAQPIDDPDPHWQLGGVVAVDVCDVPDTVTGGPCSANGITKAPTVSGTPLSAATPFTVYAWIQCSPVGHGDDLGDLVSKTDRLLTNGESRAIEQVFWTGQVSNGAVVYPHLAEDTQVFSDSMGAQTVELQSAATVVTGSPTSLMEGLALLEGALAACYGGEGVIHVPAGAVAHLSNVGVVKAQGAQLRTLLGNVVVAHAPGNREGPTGSNPPTGQTWLYATGAMMIRRSPIKRNRRPGDFVGRAKNTSVYVAERTYLIDWDCCHFATLVSVTGLGT